jgi:L-serine dehydratase
MERHPNALRFEVWDATSEPLLDLVYYSPGGGFIEGPGADDADREVVGVPAPFASAAELLRLCDAHGASIADIARANDEAIHGADALDAGLDAILDAMGQCVDRGMTAHGTLPGGLGVRRRAADMATKLREMAGHEPGDHSGQWLQAFALAVSEENAIGSRVVTAPTNGAAGVIPAVITYARRLCSPARGPREFLLAAGAIGGLYKVNGSISGAEAGCQGEVGVAASMAAGGMCHILGGTPRQVENAAEIAMEHNLGLTCDPVGGLVQLPCIERNAMAAGVAVSAARLALAGDGSHRISLDTVIETMVRTGQDMSSKYKETSLGGLAVSFVVC